MTKYHTQFDESTQTIGTTLAGWTHRTAATAPTYVPAYGTPAVKRRYLAHASGQSGELRGLITWDALDTDANRATCNLLTCISVDAFTAGTADLWARVAMSGTTIQDGYRLRLISGGGAGSFNLSKRVASVTTSSFASASPTIAAGKSYFIRFDLNGTALKAKIWDAALGMAGEPSAWDISTTDSGVSAAGYIGLAMNATAGTVVPWNFFAVGTNGDSAVCPITNAEYLAWLASQTALRVVTAELTATGYDSGGAPYTKTVNWYIADGGYTSHQQDTPSGKHYDGVITSVPTFRREMSSALSGAAQTGFGDLVVTNPGQVPKHEKYTAVDLNGSSQYALASSSSTLNFGTSSFSVLIRGRYDDFTPSRAFGGVTKPGSAWNTAAGWGFGQGHTGTSIFAWIHDGVNFASGYITCDAGYRPIDLVGQFVEILYIVDRSAGAIKVMINGVMQSGSLSISSVTGSVNNANNFQVSLSVGWYQDGLLDEVRAWSRALSVSDGVSIYNRRGTDQSASLALLWPCNEGTGTSLADKSGNSNTGTLLGSPSWVTGTRTLKSNEDQPGSRDDLLRMRWNRNYLKLYLGDPSWPKHDFRLIVLGRLGMPTAPDEKTIRFPIADLSDFFNKDINPDLFTSGNLKDSPQPLVFGEVNIIEPPLTDTANLIYTLSKDALYYDTSFGIQNAPIAYDNDVALFGVAGTISTTDTATDELTTSVNHGAVVGSTFQYFTGTVPAVSGAALALNTDYFVVSVPATNKLKISRTRGGAAIDFTGATSGQTYGIYNYIPPASGAAPATMQLLATPAGRVTVQTLKDNRYTTTPGKPGSVYSAMVFDKLGLSLNFKDSTALDALNTDVSTYRAGLWIPNEKVRAADALNALAQGTLTWYCITPDGLFRAGRIGLPASSAVMSFTESDIVMRSMRQVDVIRAKDASKARWTYNRWFLTRGPLQPSQYTSPAVVDGKVVVAPPATGATSTPLDSYPTLADADTNSVFDTLLTSGIADFQANTKALFLQSLGIFEFETRLPASQLNIGDTISLTFPRLGWKSYSASDPASPDNTATVDATKAVVIGIDTDIGRGRVKLKVFRRIPGYYPTSDLN